MGKSISLEEEVISKFVVFALENKEAYTVKSSFLPQPNKDDNAKDLILGFGKNNDIFVHKVVLLNGEVDTNLTLHVAVNIEARQIYTKFIDYMNSQGIELTNELKSLWRKYPV